jgi:DNA-binding CsgD family transcriptional regulator
MRENKLYGRRSECHALDRLLTDVRAGQSRALVLRGEPGAGKTALLDFLTGAAAGCRVLRVAGVPSETRLAFAGLHRLCAPMLSRVERLPESQRDALRYTSGLAAGPSPDGFLVGLAVLNLLAGAAGERPLICVIDDEQWLDHASVQTLGFAARRLAAAPVGLVFAAREPSAALAGLPELHVGGLQDDDARALLAAALAGPLDVRVRDLIVAETRGNPQALLEVPRALSPAELAGGFGLPGAAPLADRVQDRFTRQLATLPDQTLRLVQLAAADPSGDRQLLWRAAGRLGIPAQAAVPAAEAGLVEFGTRVRFRHPLARSAAYWSASYTERRAVHAALAEVTDREAEPDRRAWHRAQAVSGPDEEVAAELEQSAGRAQARGGLAAAAAFLERSVLLTADPARYAERVLAAARASLLAGAFGKARELLAEAEAGPLDELAGARVALLRGQITLASGLGSEAAALLLQAAKRLESLDAGLAREAYLSAWMAALSAGRLAAGGDLFEICRAARALPPPVPPVPPAPPAPPAQPGTVDLVLDGLALIVTDGLAAATPALRRAVRAFADGDITAAEASRWGWPAQAAASLLWDHDSWRALLVRQVRLAREDGALGQLPVTLDALGTAVAASGDLASAAALTAEADKIREATGMRATRLTAMLLAALRGCHAEAAALIEATITEAEADGQGIAVAYGHWAAAILHNGLGRYADALTAAQLASEDSTALPISMWALPELVEAAARGGQAGLARDALKQLAEITQACGHDQALGIEARCRALLSHDADALYREAISRLGRTGLRPELARAYLLYGEWLRREGRRVQAREQLRTAHGMLAALGMAAFAERARRELIATGETVRERSVETVTALTAQEAVIARLARDGRTNPQIGAQLFLSGRTVEWHLRKIFTKLGISSRRELHAALAQAA